MSKRTHKHRCGYVPRPREPHRYHFLAILDLEIARLAMAEQRTCGLVFEHERPPDEATREEYRAAHLCPACGAHNTYVYKGRLKAGQGRKGERRQG